MCGPGYGVLCFIRALKADLLEQMLALAQVNDSNRVWRSTNCNRHNDHPLPQGSLMQCNSGPLGRIFPCLTAGSRRCALIINRKRAL